MANQSLPLLPWQAADWERVVKQWRAGSLPHAIMLCGQAGTGMGSFAAALGRLLLCLQPTGRQPCGECRACRLLAAQTHPDLLTLKPDSGASAIKVDQVRTLLAFARGTAQQGGARVAIVQPAESMNLNAANSLLKILEEPGPDTHLILLSHSPLTVLPTVRSRCQSLAMSQPTPAQCRQWLEANGADPAALELLLSLAPQQPLYLHQLLPQTDQIAAVSERLVELIEGRADRIATAAAWAKLDALQLIGWLYRWLSAACLADVDAGAGDGLSRRIHGAWAARAPLAALVECVEALVALRKQLMSGGNPNRQLMLENLVWRLAEHAHN